jgi:hypothetical protein
MPARSCHPRDLIDHLCDNARYLSHKPELTVDLLDRACKSYFLDMPDESYVPDPAEYRYGGGRQQATMGSIAEMISGGEELVGEGEPPAEATAEEPGETADPASPGGA